MSVRHLGNALTATAKTWLDGTTIAFSRDVTYDNQGLVVSEIADTKRGIHLYRSVTTNSYAADNTLTASSALNSRNGVDGDAPDTLTTNTYAWYDGAVQKRVVHDPDSADSGGAFTSDFFYNAFGHLISSGIYDGRQREVFFDNTVEGQAIKRLETDTDPARGDPLQLTYIFGGRQMGSVGNDGTRDIAYETSIAERTRTVSNADGAFRGGAATGVGHADFGGDYDAINSYRQGSGPSGSGGSYTVRGGESLQGIAASLWGDGALWYKLAEANGLAANAPLTAGRTLTIPAGVQRIHHNAGTVKPYDPAAAIGDLSPTTPNPPKGATGNKCGVVGLVLLAVVAVAVTIATSGAFLAATGAVQGGIGAGIGAVLGTTGATVGAGALAAAGAVGGAVGSIVSQGVGLATGIQSKFSFKGVALGALSGAAGGALRGVDAFKAGALGKFTPIANSAARGALGSVLTQGVTTATGLQSKFDFAGVAAAGVGAGVGGEFARRTGFDAGSNLYNAASATAGGIANAATRSALNGDSFGKNLIAAIPDVIGQAVGGAIGRALVGDGRSTSLQKPLEQAKNSPVALQQPGAQMQANPSEQLRDDLLGIRYLTSEGRIAFQGSSNSTTIQNVNQTETDNVKKIRARARYQRSSESEIAKALQDNELQAEATRAALRSRAVQDIRSQPVEIAATDPGSLADFTVTGPGRSHELVYTPSIDAINASYEPFRLYEHNGISYTRESYYQNVPQASSGPAPYEVAAQAYQQRLANFYFSRAPGGVGIGDTAYIAATTNGASEQRARAWQTAGAFVDNFGIGRAGSPRAPVITNSLRSPVVWNNGWRTLDGRFTSPLGSGRPGGNAEVKVWNAIDAKPGWRVDRGAIGVRDASGQLRYYDGVAYSPNGKIIGLEVKSNSARLTGPQRTFDMNLNANISNLATGVGRNPDLTIQRSTIIRTTQP